MSRKAINICHSITKSMGRWMMSLLTPCNARHIMSVIQVDNRPCLVLVADGQQMMNLKMFQVARCSVSVSQPASQSEIKSYLVLRVYGRANDEIVDVPSSKKQRVNQSVSQPSASPSVSQVSHCTVYSVQMCERVMSLLVSYDSFQSWVRQSISQSEIRSYLVLSTDG